MTIDIAIPVLNEKQHLNGCLKSVMAFHRPKDCELCIFVLDGGSTDGTLNIARAYAKRYPEIRVIKNPGRIQSCAMNIVLKEGIGDFILRLDAHAEYPKNYLCQCIQTALETGADNVGGVIRTHPGGNTFGAKLVQALTTHCFGIGNAKYRLSGKAGPVDTVPYGFFRREVFRSVGLYDERLVRNQDYELNRRIVMSGGRIWLNPSIVVEYFNQPTLSAFLKKQLAKEGQYNAYLWYLAPYAIAYRHGITGAFTAGIIMGGIAAGFSDVLRWVYFSVLILYFLLAGMAALQQALRYRCFRHLLCLPPAFFLFHFTHGLGFLWGALRLHSGTASVQKIREPWPGAGRYRAWPIPEKWQNTEIVTAYCRDRDSFPS